MNVYKYSKRQFELGVSSRGAAHATASSFRQQLGEKVLRVPGVPNFLQPVITNVLSARRHHGYCLYKINIRTESDPIWDMPVYILRPNPDVDHSILLIGLNVHGPGAAALVDLIDSEIYPRVTKKVIEEENYNCGLRATEVGFTLVVPELRGCGELRDPEKIQLGRNKDVPFMTVYSCPEIAGRLALLGRTLLGMRVYDVMFLAAYLSSGIADEDIFGSFNKSRIGIFGHSGGGTTALFTAALSQDNIKATCISGYLNSFKSSILAVSHCACNYVQDLALLGDISDFAGLIAPRPLLAVSGIGDKIYPIEAARDGAEKLRKIYRDYQAEERFTFVELEDIPGKRGHRFPDGDMVWDWFAGVLK